MCKDRMCGALDCLICHPEGYKNPDDDPRFRFVTILDIVKAKGAKIDSDGGINGEEFARLGYQIIGGCSICGACISADHAFPTTEGYWMCRHCVDDDGFETVADYDAWLKEEDE